MESPSELLQSIKWRQAGPFRGGRVVAVAGHPTEQRTFYFGACAGGVFKTDDGGITWKNISDGYFKTGSVGAIAVSEADPNVIYVGMGESCIRGNVIHGDGVYRSDDGGETWRHLGLAATRHIGRVRVHPKNPDLVYVAAFGHAYGQNEERGVYRSSDGGQTWEKILYRNANTGAIDLCLDPHNPRIMYTSFWEAQRYPYTLISGGEGSGIFKSVDGGDHWEELTNNPGLPEGLKGRIGIALSPARKGRVWAMVEAKDGGLYRTDDGGATWSLINDNPDLRQRPWYYMHTIADPVDPETVWVLNLAAWKSIDGGKSLIRVPTPHGDNHDLWIDPHDTNRMIEGNDGGACVSYDGGRTWSSIYNQPTVQFYHVTTDDQFPYRIYGAQQDNSTLSVPSYSDRGAITNEDCYAVAGGESGYIAVRQDKPNIVYAGSFASRMTRYDHNSRQAIEITPWPEDPIGRGAESMRYRVQWTFPIHLSPHDQNLLYTTGNVVFRSHNGGQSWEVISPDLTVGDPETLKPAGGPITKDNVSTEFYGTIFAFAESPVRKGVLWTGSDDGLIHVSQDDGAGWTNVTPTGMSTWPLISIIEAGQHDAGTAYVAATRYKMDDFKPYLFKTHDYGQTWEKITNGIAEEDFTHAIREDPVRRGLLYAGTETGLYISWDDGANWTKVESNLPVVSIHDIAIKGTDLIAATHGRSFWVLDDINALRSWPELDASAAATVFPVRTAYKVKGPRRFGREGTLGYKVYLETWVTQAIAEVVPDGHGGSETRLLTAGDNPPLGAMITYRIGKANAKDVSLTFLTEDGTEIKRFSSNDKNAGKTGPHTTKGLHRFHWDMRWPETTKIEGAVISAYWGGSTIGPEVVPGTYQVRLEVDGQVSTQTFTVEKDPRVDATQEDLEAQFQLLLQIRDKLGEVHDAYLHSREVRRQLDDWRQRLETQEQAELAAEVQRVSDKVFEVAGELVESRSRGHADSFNYPPKVNSKLASLEGTVAYGDGRPPKQCYEVFELLSKQADEGLANLRQVMETDVAALNKKIAGSGVDPIG